VSGGFRNGGRFMRRSRPILADKHEDPTEAMANLIDVFLLVGVALLIFSLSGFGLKDLLSKSDVTIVKNPGKIDMELIVKSAGSIRRLKASGKTAQGAGTRIGSVYRLQNGQVVWVPETEAP